MTFSSDKDSFLEKEDQSVKGSIDGHIKELCDLINTNPEYYTTSSCSGRIVILKVNGSEKKGKGEWLFSSHDEAGWYNMHNELCTLPKEDVWFRYQPLLLHVTCHTLLGAEVLLKLAKASGMKHSGIIETGAQFVVELVGPGKIRTIIAKDGKLLVSDHYLEILIDAANINMKKNWDCIANLTEEFRKI